MTNNKKGFVLVVTLLLMVSISTIGLLALINAQTETLIGRNEKEQKFAFQLAEAGLNEAYARVHLPSGNGNYLGEKSSDTGYRTSSWQKSFNQSTSINNLCSGSSVTCTYSVTIQYLLENSTDAFCNPSGACTSTDIVMFGQDYQFPSTMTPIPPSTGYLPVYKITSTGVYGNTTVQVISYNAASSLNTDTSASINTNGCVTNNGGVSVDTICYSTGCSNPDCDATKGSTTDMNTYLGYTIANLAAMADKQLSCSSVSTCGQIPQQITDAEWGDYSTNTYSSFIYINNTNEVSITGNDLGADNGGRGILVIQGDLSLSGGFQWEGLIYVLGNLSLNGGGSGVNVTGGIMTGNTTVLNGGNLNITYDTSTLQSVGMESGNTAVVRWARQ